MIKLINILLEMVDEKPVSLYRYVSSIYPNEIDYQYKNDTAWKLGRGTYFYTAKQMMLDSMGYSNKNGKMYCTNGWRSKADFKNLLVLTNKDLIGINDVDPTWGVMDVKITQSGADKLGVPIGNINIATIKIPDKYDAVYFPDKMELLVPPHSNLKINVQELYISIPKSLDNLAHELNKIVHGKIIFHRIRYGSRKLLLFKSGAWIIQYKPNYADNATQFLIDNQDILNDYYKNSDQYVDKFDKTKTNKYKKNLTDFMDRDDMHIIKKLNSEDNE